ncbi:hypothetical protein GCM10027346_38050 [Hymenobacter seoulensis]
MLTQRTPLLTILLSLCTVSLATAQSAAPSGPTPTDLLSWLAGGLAAVVLIFGVMTATSLAAAAAEAAQQDPPAATPADATAPVPATEERVAA